MKFFETKDEAQAWLDNLRKARRQGTYIPAKSIPPFGEMTTQFTASKQVGYTPNTTLITVRCAAICPVLRSIASMRSASRWSSASATGSGTRASCASIPKTGC